MPYDPKTDPKSPQYDPVAWYAANVGKGQAPPRAIRLSAIHSLLNPGPRNLRFPKAPPAPPSSDVHPGFAPDPTLSPAEHANAQTNFAPIDDKPIGGPPVGPKPPATGGLYPPPVKLHWWQRLFHALHLTK